MNDSTSGIWSNNTVAPTNGMANLGVASQGIATYGIAFWGSADPLPPCSDLLQWLSGGATGATLHEVKDILPTVIVTDLAEYDTSEVKQPYTHFDGVGDHCYSENGYDFESVELLMKLHSPDGNNPALFHAYHGPNKGDVKITTASNSTELQIDVVDNTNNSASFLVTLNNTTDLFKWSAFRLAVEGGVVNVYQDDALIGSGGSGLGTITVDRSYLATEYDSDHYSAMELSMLTINGSQMPAMAIGSGYIRSNDCANLDLEYEVKRTTAGVNTMQYFEVGAPAVGATFGGNFESMIDQTNWLHLPNITPDWGTAPVNSVFEFDMAYGSNSGAIAMGSNRKFYTDYLGKARAGSSGGLTDYAKTYHDEPIKHWKVTMNNGTNLIEIEYDGVVDHSATDNGVVWPLNSGSTDLYIMALGAGNYVCRGAYGKVTSISLINEWTNETFELVATMLPSGLFNVVVTEDGIETSNTIETPANGALSTFVTPTTSCDPTTTLDGNPASILPGVMNELGAPLTQAPSSSQYWAQGTPNMFAQEGTALTPVTDAEIDCQATQQGSGGIFVRYSDSNKLEIKVFKPADFFLNRVCADAMLSWCGTNRADSAALTDAGGNYILDANDYVQWADWEACDIIKPLVMNFRASTSDTVTIPTNPASTYNGQIEWEADYNPNPLVMTFATTTSNESLTIATNPVSTYNGQIEWSP